MLPEWKPVLRKFGQLLHAVSPDAEDANYLEVFKMCNNPKHFFNIHLTLNKSGSANPRTIAKRKESRPKVEIRRASQKMCVLFMSAFLWNQFQALPEGSPYSDVERVDYAMGLLEITQSEDMLFVLGYDIALRNWILDFTKQLEIKTTTRSRRDIDYGEESETREIAQDFMESVQYTIMNMTKKTDDMEDEIKVLKSWENARAAMEARLSKIERFVNDHEIRLQAASTLGKEVAEMEKSLNHTDEKLDSLENVTQDIIGYTSGFQVLFDRVLAMDIRLRIVENIPENEEAELGPDEHESDTSDQDNDNGMEPEIYDHGAFEDAARQEENNVENENTEMSQDQYGDH